MGKQKRFKAPKAKKQPNKELQYVFQLKRLKNQANFDPIFADFGAIQQPQNTKPANKLYPFFLKDSQPFTPSFFFPVLGSYDFSNFPTHYIQKEDQKEKDEDNVCLTIAEPQPGPYSRICGVCRRQYDQYFSHSESQIHMNWLKQSEYQKRIKQFCESYYKNPTKSAQMAKQQIRQGVQND